MEHLGSRDIKIIDPTGVRDYDKLVLSHPGATFFHSSAWARVLVDSYGFKPCYLLMGEDGSPGAIVPLMKVRSLFGPVKAVGLPFTDECAPLMRGNQDPSSLLQRLISFGREKGWRYLEWRGGPWVGEEPCSLEYLTHRLDLELGEADLYRSLRDSTRRNIAKAQREGVEVSIETTLSSISGFFRLHCLTRKRHGLPPQPFHFFGKIWEHVVCQGYGFIVLASHQGEIVAGAAFVHFGPHGVYKFGASSAKAQPLRANNLVMWEGIRECIRRGCLSLSLGRTDKDNKGLLQFKRGWGGREMSLRYYAYDLRKGSLIAKASRETGWHTKFFSLLPVSALRLLGAILYPRMA